MRKSIVAILSLVAMVACTNDVTVNTQAPAAISFEDSFVEVKTRAAADPSITTATIDAFDVWGFMDDPNGLMFDAQRVTKGEGGWTYNPLQFWTQDHNYFFYAVAPVDNADIVVNKDLNIEGLGTIDFTNTDGSVDLLYAEKEESTYNENVSADGHQSVKFTFAHLLSKVKFTFTNGFPEGTSSLKIENIKISNAPSKGTVTLNDDTAGRTWKVTDSKAVLDFGHVNGGVALLPSESAECDSERLTIPADANVRYQIDFTATLYYGDNVALVSNRTAYLEDQAFVIGKNYNIKVTIDATNIAEDALTPIVFDVVEVEDWELGEHNGKIDYDNDGTQVNPDEPVEEGYKLYFNNLANWTKVYAHIWANEGEDLGLEASEWPGRELTETEELDGVTYYVFQLPATATGKTVNVVFNDGAGSQTKDLAGVAEGNLFFDNYVEPVAPSDVVLYLQPNSNWMADSPRFAAYFFGNGETWVDMTLVEGETNIYAVTVPAGFESVIFCRMNPGAADNNWNNKWNQTDDLTVPTDGTNLYTVTEDTWDKGGGEWSVYAPSAVEPEPETPAAGSQVSVAKFLEMADTATEYVLTGKVARVVNTQYGNFDLTDETGTIYIYGLCSPEGAQQYWAESGVREGDTITVKGKYSVYNNSPQVKNAIYVSHVPAPFVFAEAAAIEADVVEVSISVESNVAWTVSCDAAWVKSYSKSGTGNSDIDIEVEANTTTENRVATFTISGEGVAEYTVTLTQYGAGASDTRGTYTSEAFLKGGTDGGKSYQEKVNVGGTQYDCLKLGTSSVIGKYTTKAVGESGDLTLSFYAVGWNGKTSKLNVYVDGVKVGETLTLTGNSGAANNAPYTITPSDTTDYYSISVPGITEASKITFETVSGATRAIIFGVQLY